MTASMIPKGKNASSKFINENKAIKIPATANKNPKNVM